MEEDNRLLPMLASMSKSYLGQDYGKKTSAGQITADMIEMVGSGTWQIGENITLYRKGTCMYVCMYVLYMHAHKQIQFMQ